MVAALIVIGLIFICFAGVIVFGAPYLPTLKSQLDSALNLAEVKPGERLIELGCGDGRVLLAAAKLGVKSVGYELNPLLAIVAWLRTRRYHSDVKVIWGNYWHKQWPPADYIFTFLLDKYMDKLDKKIDQYPSKPVYLISFAFKIPSKPITAQNKGVYLYRYN